VGGMISHEKLPFISIMTGLAAKKTHQTKRFFPSSRLK
jgi:hypothetical protein